MTDTADLIIQPFGGVGEIGGNKILLYDRKFDVKIFLDFGVSFNKMGQFFEFPFDTPKNRQELLMTEAIPDACREPLLCDANLYTTTFCDRRRKRDQWIECSRAGHFPEADAELEPGIDAVFVSHAHLDHFGRIATLNRKIPVYMGECAQHVVEARRDKEYLRFHNNYFGLDVRPFRHGDRIEVPGAGGTVVVEPVHQDHSIPGAYCFFITTSVGVVLYTGDFRMHGNEEFFHGGADLRAKIEAVGDIEVMLCEGTTLPVAQMWRERDVKRAAHEVVQNATSTVFCDFNDLDFDRFRTFYEVAQENDRQIVVSPVHAWFLMHLNRCAYLEHPNGVADENIRLFLDESKSRYFPKSANEDFTTHYGEISADNSKFVTAAQIQADPAHYVFCPSFSNVREVRVINPGGVPYYILSHSEPFNETGALSEQILFNWLENLGVPGFRIHTSGHANPAALRRVIEWASPRHFITMHTEYPEMLAAIAGLVVDPDRVHRPRVGEQLHF